VRGSKDHHNLKMMNADAKTWFSVGSEYNSYLFSKAKWQPWSTPIPETFRLEVVRQIITCERLKVRKRLQCLDARKRQLHPS
jgi:hypothetical protein